MLLAREPRSMATLASVIRDEAVGIAREAVKRQGCFVHEELGAARFFSLRGMWFRWSIALGVEHVRAGRAGQVWLEVSEWSGRACAEQSFVLRGQWRPPPPLRETLVLNPLMATLCALLLVIGFPPLSYEDRAPSAAQPSSLPHCPVCRSQLRTPLARQCFEPGCSWPGSAAPC